MVNVLKETEIEDLILKYQSELAKLEFQVSEVKSVLTDLSQHLAGIKSKALPIVRKRKSTTNVAPKPVKSVSPKIAKAKKITKEVKVAPTKTTPSKPAKKRVAKAPKGYKLSNWDELVVASIRKSKKALRTKELTDLVLKSASTQGLSSDFDLVSNKVIRSLQKLANRRNDLAKVAFPGKGFMYALPSWVEADGSLKDNFK